MENIEKLENILGGHLLEQGAYYFEYGTSENLTSQLG